MSLEEPDVLTQTQLPIPLPMMELLVERLPSGGVSRCVHGSGIRRGKDKRVVSPDRRVMREGVPGTRDERGGDELVDREESENPDGDERRDV